MTDTPTQQTTGWQPMGTAPKNATNVLLRYPAQGVKGGDGLIGSLGPIMRGAIKTGRAERSVGRDFDVLLLAHFHQAIWQPASGIIVNGAFKGHDEYARKQRYSFAPPTQWFWFSHPTMGPNIPHDIRLEAPQARAPVPFVAMPERGDS